jgi:leucyl/phenylalanyl-tRNA---protein transferase
MPVEPPPTPWTFPPARQADDVGVVGVGADLEPGTLLAAYRRGIFPMPIRGGHRLAWWSPDPRGVLPLDGLRLSRSLRQSCGRFETRVDTAFEEVIERCADPGRDGGWINRDIIDAYTRLHRLGWAHSVETWKDDRLVGGLYGVSIGGLFAGESMFHDERDASKVALVALVARLADGGASLLDVQWTTPHLASLGVADISRTRYLRLLRPAIRADVEPFAR